MSRIFLTRGASESKKHILLKVLSFLAFYRPRLSIERRVDQRFKPDLVQAHPEGEIRLWIECGKVKVRKIEQVLRKNPRAELLVVKGAHREMRSFYELVSKQLRNLDRLHFAAFEGPFIRILSSALARQNRVSMTLKRGAMEVEFNGVKEESELLFLPPGSGRVLLHT